LNRTAILAAVTLVVSVGVVFALTRTPARHTAERITTVEHQPTDPTPARDETHYAPGSPAAVAERFLRERLRHHYEDASALATATERGVCQRRLQQYRALTSEQREDLQRVVQVQAEAMQFNLARAVTEDLPPTTGDIARKRVHGVLHARYENGGQGAETARGQTLEMHLVEGAWRVAEWTPDPTDAGP
jgi:hypothetical protein